MAETKVKSPWEEKRTVRLDRAKGENAIQTALVSVNGRDFYIPRGVSVEVPLPVYEVIEESRNRLDIYDRKCEELNRNANSRELK